MPTKLVLYSQPPEMFVKHVNDARRPKDDDKHKDPSKPKHQYIEVDPRLKLDIDITVGDKVGKAIEDSPLLLQEIRNAIDKSGEYHKLVSGVAWIYDYADANVEAEEMSPKEAMEFGLKTTEKVVKEATKAMEKTVKRVYDTHFHDQQEYTCYTASIVTRLSLGAASLTTNIALLAVTPFSFGASTVVGGIGMAKTCVILAQTIVDSLKDVEAVFREVQGIYQRLTDKERLARKIADHAHNPWPVKADLYTTTLVNGIVGALVGIEPLDSLKKLSGRLDLAQKKLVGVELNLHKISAQILAQIELQAKYDKRLEEAKGSKLADDRIEEIRVKLEKSAHDMNKLVGSIHGMGDKHKKLLKTAEKYETWVKMALDQNRDVKIFGDVMTYLGIAYDIGSAFVGFSAEVNDITGAVSNVAYTVVGEAGDRALEHVAKH